jgi:hypothetical protein
MCLKGDEMNKEIENIIENYGNLGTLEPRAGFEASVMRKIENRMEAGNIFAGFLLKPALIIMILILNIATVFTIALQDGKAKPGTDNIASVAEDYNIDYSSNYIFNYDGVE